MLIEVQPLESFSSFVKGVRKPQRTPKPVKVAPTTAPTTGFIHASLHFSRKPTNAPLLHLFTFSAIVEQTPPADTQLLETDHQETSFEPEPVAKSNDEVIAVTTPNPKKQPSSSKQPKKQAPPPSKETQDVPGWDYFWLKKIIFYFSLAHTVLVQPLHSSAH